MLWFIVVILKLLIIWWLVTWLVDRKRQRQYPPPPAVYGGQETGHGNTCERRAPMFAGKKWEKVAEYSDMAWRIRTAGVLKFCGHTPHAFLIRAARLTDASHIADVYVDEAGMFGERDEIYVIDSCEGSGVTMHKLRDAVEKYPGQWSYADIIPELEDKYDREWASEGALKAVKDKVEYGYVSIVLLAAMNFPVLCLIAYATGIYRSQFFAKRPICSQFKSNLMRRGGLDPAHGRDAWLVVPADYSPLPILQEWTAIMPDKVKAAA